MNEFLFQLPDDGQGFFTARFREELPGIVDALLELCPFLCRERTDLVQPCHVLFEHAPVKPEEVVEKPRRSIVAWQQGDRAGFEERIVYHHEGWPRELGAPAFFCFLFRGLHPFLLIDDVVKHGQKG